jgi:hypothetical protein
MVIKLLKKAFIFLLIILALIAIVLLSIGKKPVNTFIEQQIVSAAQQQGIRLAFENAEVGLMTFSAKSAEVFVSPLLLLLPFKNVSLAPHYGSLLKGSLDATLKAQFAGSEATLTGVSIGPNGAILNGHIQKLDIASIQQLSMLGISKGIAEIHADNVHIDADNDFPTTGTVGITIQQIEKPNQTIIPLTLDGLPLSLTIPPLNRGKVEGVINFGQGSQAVVIRKLDWLSSWGAVSLSGALSSERELKLKGETFLSNEGSEAFRSYLPLISQGRLKYETKKFSFSITGPMRRPQVLFTALD